MSGGSLRLLADIGGTNARFALQGGDGALYAEASLAVAEHPSLAAAAKSFLEKQGRGATPDRAAIAVAAPVAGERVDLTNSAWSFSLGDLQAELGLPHLHVVNDFVAVALAVMKLSPVDVRQIGGGTALPATPIAVLGPGTGLGVSGLVPAETGWVPLATEGGHVTLPAVTDREAAVVAALRAEFGHVSAERVLSGPGLATLYRTLAALDGKLGEPLSPDDVTTRAVGNTDPICREAVAIFCALLGTVAGDLALSLGARGGVFIAGGIIPDIVETFAASDFRERFEDKGRFRTYMAEIPTHVITHERPAFLGLAAILETGTDAHIP